MKKAKISSSLRPIAFFLVAIILVCSFGFSADGWQFNKNSDGYDDINVPVSGEASAPTTPSVNAPPPEDAPVYINIFTGLQTTEELSSNEYVSFIIDPFSPLYGISYSDVIIEFPTECGTKLSFITNRYSDLSKIGPLTANRDCFNEILSTFCNTAVSYGYKFLPGGSYSDSLSTLDLKKLQAYHYVEFDRFAYTGGGLITTAITESQEKDTITYGLPFCHNDSDEPIKSESYFRSIKLQSEGEDKIELLYDSELHGYKLLRNGSAMSDALNSQTAFFANCLVLFTDSVTYEDSSGTYMKINTVGKGGGYYFTEGTAFEIEWQNDAENGLKLFNKNGDVLSVNRGNLYISFIKSSQKDQIILS